MSSRRELIRWATRFAILNGIVLTALAASYLRHAPAPHGWLAQTFIALALPSQLLTIALLPWLILVLLALLLPNRRLIIGFASVTYCALFLLVLVDTRVFALHRFHLNSMVWNVLTGGAASQILVFSRQDWALACGVVLTMLVGQLASALVLWRRCDGKPIGRGFAIGGILFALILATQAIHVWADAVHYTPILAQARILPWPQSLVTAKRLLRRSGIDVQRMDAPDMNVSGLLRYPRNPIRCADQPPSLNLLIIVVEGLRFDMADREVMPSLHALGKESWLFDNHFSGGNATRFGIFTLFYGVHGSYWPAFLSEGVGPVLMSEVERHGYDLGIFASASLRSPEFDRTVFVEVADHLQDPPAEKTVDQRDVEITRRLERRLERSAGNKPFFGFLFYDAPHKYAYPASFTAPFKPDLEAVSYVTLGSESDPVPFRNRYKNSLRFIDGLIGELISFLRERGLFEKTILLVTGDHGQEFNETGLNYWGHNGNFSRYQIQVPLVVRWPGTEPRKVTHPTSHMDVAPTLMRDYFVCENPTSDYSQGRHLLDDSPRDYLTVSSWSTSAIVEGKTVMVLENYGLELHDLDDYSMRADQTPDLSLLGTVMRSRSQFLVGGGD